MSNEKKGFREFPLTTLAVDNATSVFLLAFMILYFGYNSYNDMPKEQFPEINIPTIFVNTPYPGNSAVDIENLVTRPIEKELKAINGIKKVESTSMQDFSVIVVEFNTDVDISDAMVDVKDAVDRAKAELPNDLPNDPVVQDIDLGEFPIMTVNLSGEFTNDELRNYAEYLQDELEDIDEILRVEIKGALEREVKIEVDLKQMEARQVSFRDIQTAIEAENITMSGGEIVAGGFRNAVRIIGEFTSVEEIADIVVKSENIQPVYLRDIAEVSFSFMDRTSYARMDQHPVVSLDVIKRSGANLLSASDKIKEAVERAQQEELPAALSINVFNDQSINIRSEVSNLENSIISGVILVVLVLLFFLGIRNALFVGIAIPLSMLMGIMFLYLTGSTLNIIVLFSLILALGLLVDNGIVVVENIYRYMQEGFSGVEAAKKGAGEVALPIIASTATTLAAFLPLAFWPGIMGSFMSNLPITLIAVLTSSLFVALVVNPVFTARFMKVDTRSKDPERRRRKQRNRWILVAALTGGVMLFHMLGWDAGRNICGIVALVTLLNMYVLRPASFYFQDKVIPLLESVYDNFIRLALRAFMPIVVFLGTFGLLVLAIILLAINAPKVIFFPDIEPIYVNAFVEMDMGTDIEVTNELMQTLERDVEQAMAPYVQVVDAILAQVGEGTSDPAGPPEPGVSPNKARLTVAFVPANERNGVNTRDLMEIIRRTVQGHPGATIVVEKNAAGPPQGRPVNLELRGDDINELLVLSQDVLSYLNEKNVPGVEELQADIKLAKPEQTVYINRETARMYGVSTRDIASTIRTALYGMEVSKFKQGEDDFPINIRANEHYRYNKDALMSQVITFRDPGSGRISQVPINTVATIEYGETFSAVKRKDMQRMITIYSNVTDGYNANEIVDELRGYMDAFLMPRGYDYEFTGQQQEQMEAMDFLSTAFVIALFVIFIILVSQFNSIYAPFIIVLTILFSIIGVLMGYVSTGRDLVVVMTGVGIISLAGIVVNNAIVLIDYINLLIKRKREELSIGQEFRLPNEMIREAIIRGGAIRLRPVLLTAITTVLGLIPLAIGFNFNFFTLVTELNPRIFIGGDNVAFWGPMAWTVIYGLVFSTFLTLIVVPVMYWLFYHLSLLINKLLGLDRPVYES